VGTYFQLVLMVADEIRRVPHELLDVASTLGARKREVIAQVLVRSALPGIFDALRLCNGWAWTYVIVAELVAANEGLGYRILKFSRFLQTPKIWVYLLVMGGLGLGLDVGFRLLNRRLFRWADTTR
jgi:NitT/TauT family transport system permease protein